MKANSPDGAAGLTACGFGWKYLHASPNLHVPCNIIKKLTEQARLEYSGWNGDCLKMRTKGEIRNTTDYLNVNLKFILAQPQAVQNAVVLNTRKMVEIKKR